MGGGGSGPKKGGDKGSMRGYWRVICDKIKGTNKLGMSWAKLSSATH